VGEITLQQDGHRQTFLQLPVATMHFKAGCRHMKLDSIVVT